MTRARTPLVAGAAVLTVVLAACGEGGEPTTSNQDGAYPVTVSNCGSKVTFDQAPSRVVLLKSASVPFLSELGVLDRVTARAGAYPPGYYGDSAQKSIDGIPSLTDKVDASGHLQISKETVIAQEPDLVLGEVENLSRATLSAVDIPLLEEPALCDEGGKAPTFDSIFKQMTMYGTIFDKPRQAKQSVSRLRTRVADVEKKVSGSNRTAAVLYPTVGGGATYAYGTKSMADPQLRAAGFTNVFGDVDKRVFETSPEKLLERDPDVIIMLYADGDPKKVTQTVRNLPGAKKLTAVKKGNLMPQLFNFTEPPTPLSVTGLERIVKRFPA